MKKGQKITKLPPTITECTVDQLKALSQSQPVPKPAKRAKILPEDIEQIAVMVAKRMTETEACAVVGLDPMSWFKAKHRHLKDGKFEKLVVQVRGQYVNARLTEIEQSARGEGMKQRDWRAAAWLAQVSGGDRYSTTGTGKAENLTVNVIGDDRLDKVLGRLYEVTATPIEQDTYIKRSIADERRLTDKPIEVESTEATLEAKSSP